ncbi:MAG: ATP-dependent DNA helicase DinG [Treponema sp.]|nr:ATP-dependent DNA helicase DinG [Treponema sp.]
MQAVRRFSEQCLSQLRAAIADAGGNEVFALGRLDDKGIVRRIRITARGNEGQVLAWGIEDMKEGEDPGSPPDVFIHNHPSGLLTPSDNDLAIAGKAAESGVGAYIVDNQVERVYVVAEPVRRRKQKKLNAERIITALMEGGEVARRLPSYEPRQAQLDLMKLVIRAFNEDALTAAEAGTGVGKSFAYLLPALHYALENGERIVISTATITLQQQLFEKDIPLVSSAMHKKVKAVLLKGRGNYLCRRRLNDALREPDLDGAEHKELERLAKWGETTITGSRSDLSFVPQENLWSRVCSDAELCMGLRCPERERCFILALRKEAADARIIVVNHHLLFADLAARRAGAGYEGAVVLPPYARIIIDEAHTIEAAATSFFSKEFSRLGLFRQLGRLYRRRGQNRRGLLVRVESMLPAGDRLDAANAAIEKIRAALDELDGPARELCGMEGVFRLSARDSGVIEAAIFPPLRSLRKKILSLAELVRDLLEQIPDREQDNPAVWETRAVVRRLDDIAGICAAFLEYRERPGEVMWIEKRLSGGGEPWAAFTQSPVELAPDLKASLFTPSKTVVCVSATLTVNGAFSYWAGRSGLGLVENRPVLFGIFPSPFPYGSAVLLASPEDAPLPDEEYYQDFINASVSRLAAIAGGSALILFTSYQSLRSAYNAALPELEALGIRCLRQGDDDRSRLLRAFLDDQSSVLFATDSFWEGVDAPGDTLRLVILCRLPFRSPSDPVFEARREALEKRGGNPFMDLSLPEAVMKFKQGFGRLMRRSSDHGVVAVMDGRLIKKRYGAFFLRSLPETRISFSNFETILREAERFLYS